MSSQVFHYVYLVTNILGTHISLFVAQIIQIADMLQVFSKYFNVQHKVRKKDMKNIISAND